MTPISVPFVDLYSLHQDLEDELLEAFRKILRNSAFVGGEEHDAFEHEFASYCHCQYAAGVANGTEALQLALLALGIGPGDTVVTVPNTFIATAEAISATGARVDFVDIDPATCLMDPGKLHEYLENRRTAGSLSHVKAIIPVHLYGACADMDAICALAKEYGLRVLEDAAQAHGAEYKGRRAGCLGDAAAFSFYPGKNLGAFGEGGAVTSNDPLIIKRVNLLRNHGQQEKNHHSAIGFNGRLDNLQAAILRRKLPRVDEWNAMRRAAAAKLDAAVAELESMHAVSTGACVTPVYHLYIVHTRDREALMRFLNGRGIATGMHYPVPVHLQECYAHLGHAAGDFPNAEKSASELLTLPMFPHLSDAQLEWMIESLRIYNSHES